MAGRILTLSSAILPSRNAIVGDLSCGAQAYRFAGEAEIETLDQFRHSLGSHLETVALAQTAKDSWLQIGDTALIGKLAEEAFETGWSDDSSSDSRTFLFIPGQAALLSRNPSHSQRPRPRIGRSRVWSPSMKQVASVCLVNIRSTTRARCLVQVLGSRPAENVTLQALVRKAGLSATCDKRATQGLTWPVHVNAQRRSTLRRLVCDRWNPVTLLANQVERHAYPESVQIRVESELQLTIRELRSRGSGASLDVREGSMLAMTLLPGA
jgi:hypothetical protein